MIGFVDEAMLSGGTLTVRGWAADPMGEVPVALEVRIAGQLRAVPSVERQLRPDVQRHVGLPHALVGYRFSVDADGCQALAELGPGFGVQGRSAAGEVTTFRLSAPLAAALEGAGGDE